MYDKAMGKKKDLWDQSDLLHRSLSYHSNIDQQPTLKFVPESDMAKDQSSLNGWIG